MTDRMTDRLTDLVESRIREAYATACEQGQKILLVAIDGRCAAGKTTLCTALEKNLSDVGVTVLHMDDFFLQPESRTPERLATPGGNVDHERFLADVLLPVSRGEDFTYQPFSCKTQTLQDAMRTHPAPIVLVEGAYASHPNLRLFYDLRFFLSVSPEVQISRIIARNGEVAAETFRTRWIPLEEAYIAAHHPEEGSVCLTSEA